MPSLLTAEAERCEGLVQVGAGDWSVIIDPAPEVHPVCEFATHSEIGSRILAECPDESMCRVSIPLRGEAGAGMEHDSMKRILEVLSVERIGK